MPKIFKGGLISPVKKIYDKKYHGVYFSKKNKRVKEV